MADRYNVMPTGPQKGPAPTTAGATGAKRGKKKNKNKGTGDSARQTKQKAKKSTGGHAPRKPFTFDLSEDEEPISNNPPDPAAIEAEKDI